MVTIDVYYTHIEVYPYKLGDAPRIEKIFSKYDNVTHKYVPIGYYIEDSVLYLPRGANIVLLQKITILKPSITDQLLLMTILHLIRFTTPKLMA